MRRLGRGRALGRLMALGALAALTASPVPASAKTTPGDTAGAQPGRAGAMFADTAFARGWTSSAGAAAGSSGRRHYPNRVFAGYLTTLGGRVAVHARLTVPEFSCSRREQAISPGTFLLTGPADHEYFNAANIILGCYKGKPVTEEALVINNTERDSLKPLHAGDVVVVRVADDPTGAITVEVKDVTEHHRFEVSGRGPGAAVQAELVGDWASVDSKSEQPLAPPRFAPTTFSSARVNDRAIGSLHATGFDMAAGDHTRQILTGRLLGLPRDSFTCRRKG